MQVQRVKVLVGAMAALLVALPSVRAADQLKTPALLDGDTTLVPLRELGEWIGAKVEWAAPHIILTSGTKQVQLAVGSNSAAIADGQASSQLTLARPPRVIDDVTYVPLRFVAEALGVEVHYYAAEGFVALSMGERSATLQVGVGKPPAKRQVIQAAFESAKAEGTVAAFKAFLAQWSDSSFARDATKLLNERQAKDDFEAAKADGTVAALKAYLAKWPASVHASDATKLLAARQAFEAAKAEGTLAALKRFVAQWPDSALAPEAKRLLSREPTIMDIAADPAAYGFERGGGMTFTPNQAGAAEGYQVSQWQQWVRHNANGTLDILTIRVKDGKVLDAHWGGF
jgi:hypothetical protein